MRFLGGVVPGGDILDVACGAGRHARAALAAGYHVTAVDRDLSRITDLAEQPDLRLIRSDLEAVDAEAEVGADDDAGTGAKPGAVFEQGRYAGIIVTNYLWRPLFGQIIAALKPDGVLIYETFALGNARFGKPSNPDFLLRPGELLDEVSPRLTPIAYEHVTLTGNSGPSARSEQPGHRARVVQRLCAVGPKHKWLQTPPPVAGHPTRPTSAVISIIP